MKLLLHAAIAASAAVVFGTEAFAAMDDAAANAAMSKAGCTACHSVDKKLVGPSFQDIAKKYKGDAKAVAMLSEKVRKGGAGNWGQIPMPPNPRRKDQRRGPQKRRGVDSLEIASPLLSVYFHAPGTEPCPAIFLVRGAETLSCIKTPPLLAADDALSMSKADAPFTLHARRVACAARARRLWPVRFPSARRERRRPTGRGAPQRTRTDGAAGLRFVPRHDAEGRPRTGAYARRPAVEAGRFARRHDSSRPARHRDAAVAGLPSPPRSRLDRRTTAAWTARCALDAASLVSCCSCLPPAPAAKSQRRRRRGRRGDRARNRQRAGTGPRAARERGRITDLGDLSHAAVVFSKDARYAYVFGRDGGLSKIDLDTRTTVARAPSRRATRSAGPSRATASSSQWRTTSRAASRSSTPRRSRCCPRCLPPTATEGKRAKVVGIADAPDDRFVFSLFEAGEIWIVDAADPRQPQVRKFRNVGKEPYDGLITTDGRWYIAGLFGEDGLVLLDMRNPDAGARRILDGYGRGSGEAAGLQDAAPARLGDGGRLRLPAGDRPARGTGGRYRDLEAGRGHSGPRPAGIRHGAAGRSPGVGEFRVSGQRQGAGDRRVDTAGDRIAHPGQGRAAHGVHDHGQRGVDFGARRQSRRRLRHGTFSRLAELPAESPSGIFFTWRAQKIGL